ncbi:PAK4-inhibitor inka2, partial [Dissostichus eleginoides]
AGVRAETVPTSPNLGRGRARLTDDQTKPPSALSLTLKLEANHDNTICIRNSGEVQRQQMRSKAKNQETFRQQRGKSPDKATQGPM